jgi:hypothetical protein
MTVLLSIQVSFERRKVRAPEAKVGSKPALQRPERVGLQPVDALLGRTLTGDEPRLAQHLEVLGHGRLVDPKVRAQLVHALASQLEQSEDVSSGGGGKHGEEVHVRPGFYIPIQEYS